MALVSGIQYSTEITGRRNAIINGDFDIWQRGTSHSVNGYGSVDRWYLALNTTTATLSQQSFTVGQSDVPNNPTYYCRTVVTSSAAAGAYGFVLQRIEDVRTFAGETVTLSFWAKADSAKNIAVNMLQNFGTGGSPSAQNGVNGAQQVSLTSSWQKFEVTITLDSISGKTLGTNNDSFLQVEFWFDAGSNFADRSASLGQQSGTFDIAQIQVEKGDVATEFEKRNLGEELALCQRYYEKSYDLSVTPGTASSLGATRHFVDALASGIHNGGHNETFAIRKRSTPTMVAYSPNSGTSGKVYDAGTGSDKNCTIGDIGQKGFLWYGLQTVSTTYVNMGIQWTADAEL